MAYNMTYIFYPFLKYSMPKWVHFKMIFISSDCRQYWENLDNNVLEKWVNTKCLQLVTYLVKGHKKLDAWVSLFIVPRKKFIYLLYQWKTFIYCTTAKLHAYVRLLVVTKKLILMKVSYIFLKITVLNTESEACCRISMIFIVFKALW